MTKLLTSPSRCTLGIELALNQWEDGDKHQTETPRHVAPALDNPHRGPWPCVNAMMQGSRKGIRWRVSGSAGLVGMASSNGTTHTGLIITGEALVPT